MGLKVLNKLGLCKAHVYPDALRSTGLKHLINHLGSHAIRNLKMTFLKRRWVIESVLSKKRHDDVKIALPARLSVNAINDINCETVLMKGKKRSGISDSRAGNRSSLLKSVFLPFRAAPGFENHQIKSAIGDGFFYSIANSGCEKGRFRTNFEHCIKVVHFNIIARGRRKWDGGKVFC